MTSRPFTRHTPTSGRGRLGFPASPDPDWAPALRDRWDTARRIADQHPGSPGEGGWTTDRLPAPRGVWAGLGVVAGGGAGAFTAGLSVGGLPGMSLALAGMLAATTTGMALIWHLAPADLTITPAAGEPTTGEPTMRRASTGERAAVVVPLPVPRAGTRRRAGTARRDGVGSR